MGMQKVGMAFIKMDGQLLETMPGAKLDLGGVERKEVTGNNKVLGFAETPKPSLLECEIAVGPETDLIAIGRAKNVTITFQVDTGQTWIVRNAWCVDTPSLSDGEGGKAPLKFAGPPADEA